MILGDEANFGENMSNWQKYWKKRKV